MTEGHALRLSGCILARNPKTNALDFEYGLGPADSVLEACKCDESFRRFRVPTISLLKEFYV